MNFSRSTILLILIIILGFCVRLWQIGSVPPSPNWDEVALGYNAYSILHTGRDEYGKFFPAVLRSYDDYKPAAYAYFIIPFIVFLGLNPISVRLPAVVVGTLAIVGVYFLVKEVFDRSSLELGKKSFSAEIPALLATFLLAISPWHIQFSRIAFESGVGVAFNIFALLFLLVGLRKPAVLLLSAFCFGLTPSIYQSDKVFTPLLFLVVVFVYRKSIFKVPKRYLFLAAAIGIMTIFPAAWFQLTDTQALSRAQGVSIFADQTAFLKDTSNRLLYDRERGDVLGLIFDNRRVAFIKAAIAGYLSHFDLNWLFIHGDLPRHHAPFMGLLYLWELPFLLIGIYTILFGKYDKRVKTLLILWFLIAPLPASITSGVPHAVRTLNFLPTFQVFVAFGILSTFAFLLHIFRSHPRYKVFLIIMSSCYGVLILWNTIFYLNEYFVQQNYYTSVDWQYGYKEAVESVKKIEGKYGKIIVSNQPPLDQSYMFFLFYLKYPPKDYQEENLTNLSGGFRENHAFSKYEFRPIDWTNEAKDRSILYVGRSNDFPEGVNVLEKVYYLNGDPAIAIVPGII
ncbi:MAG: hypothetical protein HYV40_03725 [Candidatus Levybacteria bacterium]|nr:hypothetical protein [Candidatus Levybacteria bacterium]